MKKIYESGSGRCPILKKLLLVMKLTAFLFVVFTMQVTATVYSQNKKLSLNMQGNSIKEVLQQIEAQSEYRFIYENEKVNLDTKVSIRVTDEVVDKILKQLFEKDGINYSITDNNLILINPSENQMKNLGKESINSQQQKSVNGKVTDTSGGTLPGVSVVVKGTTTGTITDANGKYSLSNVPMNATLLFSFVGMKTQEIAFGGKETINVALVEETIGIEEVVAVGYGTVKKSDLTGSMASVTSDDLNQGVVMSPQQMMQGKISGVSITTKNGQPGANSSVIIRGSNSINFNNNPLYVIDGVPVAFAEGNFNGPERTSLLSNNPLNMLNPADIDRIDVLKDASSTAIYGARAANGVILITTKRGNKGGQIDYETYFGTSQLRKKIPVLSATQIRSYASANPTLTFQDGGANVDWQDEIFRTAMSQSHVVSFSQGNDNTTFMASLGYIDQQGIIISSGVKNVNAKISVNSKFLDNKLNVGFNAIHANESTDNVASITGIGSDGGGDVIRDALRANPTIPVKDPNSNYSGGYSYISQFVQNPIEEAKLFEDFMESSRTIANISANLQITKELMLYTNLGYTEENIIKKAYFPLSSRYGTEQSGMASFQTRKGFSKLIETTLDYSKEINSNQKIKVLAGYSYQKFVNDQSFIQRSNFVQDISGANGIGAGGTVIAASTDKDDNTIVSFFGRLNYDLQSKYVFTATVRDDGSSRFGANSKWGFFPSVAAAWKVSEEDFLKDNKILTNLKFRLGYGKTGNQAVPNYGSLALVQTSVNLNPEIGVIAVPSTAANPKLKWETTAQTNIGVDYGFFHGKISGSFDLYQKKTSDLILAFSIPSPTAIATRLENIGDIENKGVEFDITGKVINKGNLHLEVYGNISTNRNKVLSLSKGNLITPAFGISSFNALSPQQQGSQVLITRVGESMNSLYGYEFTGFDNNGLEQFVDVTDDGVINNLDRTIIGKTQPDFIYGFGTNITWKNFDVNLSFRGVQGIDLLNSLRNDLENKTVIPNINALALVLTEGATRSPSGQVSSRFIEDASFLRLENMTVGYNFKNLQIQVINNIRLYITGQNLFVLTKYSGYDPEVNVADYTTYPRPRTMLMGLKVQF